MTNLALLFAMDPEIPQLLNSLYLMIGAFAQNDDYGGIRNEWNALNDPHAAAMVYNARPPVHRSVGLDVTLQVQMDAIEVRRRFQAPVLRPVLDMAEVWFRQRSAVTFHDPLVAVSIFDEQVCTYQRGVIDVELASPRLAGVTHFTPDASGPHDVALGVDPARFFAAYFGTTAG
jgi:inosine-uridine nucleoside N-ribohydrolase